MGFKCLFVFSKTTLVLNPLNAIMRALIVFLLLSNFQSLIAQDSSHKYYFKEVGWSVQIPVNFIIRDSTAVMDSVRSGLKLIKESTGFGADTISGKFRMLFSAKKSGGNMINASLTRYIEKRDGDFNRAVQKVRDATFNTFKAKSPPSAKLETTYTNYTIDGLEFEKYDLEIKINDTKSLHFILLSKLYRGYDFAINYLYVDNITKQEEELMLKNSKFDK